MHQQTKIYSLQELYKLYLSLCIILFYQFSTCHFQMPMFIKIFRESLIKSCWNPDYKKRPQASEIVEFLANNPRLLSPCLDVPLSSVQIEDTGQLEMSIPEGLRKCSVSLNFLNRNMGRAQSINADAVLAQVECINT